MKGTIKQTDFQFPGQHEVYRGKVRDVYFLEGDIIVMVATDRISAFDVIMPEAIPYKGMILNTLSSEFLDQTADIVPNWKLTVPHPNVTIGKKCDPLKVEMVVRGYLAGHAQREYNAGRRQICGVSLPDGLRDNEKLPRPVITPTTKADKGHDEDISREAIISSGLVEERVYNQIEKHALSLFERGSEHAKKRGLILVDTKYEFGMDAEGNITLIDEIHTPDSSRYFYAEGYEDRLKNNESQRQLSKEFVRKWLSENGFQGKEGQRIPAMPASFIHEVSDRYIELYRKISGREFKRPTVFNPADEIYESVMEWLSENRK